MLERGEMRRRIYTRRYSLGLLIAALAIIGIGVAVRPKPKRPQPAPISELESERLRRLTQERRLTDLGDYLSYAARNSAKGLVYLPDLGQTAVVIDRRTAATGIERSMPPLVTARLESGETVPLRSQPRRPDVPILLLAGPENAALPVSARAVVDTADWVLAVALRPDGNPVFAYGLYQSSAERHCGSGLYTTLRSSIPLTSAFVGGGLFALSGGVVGIIARCDDNVVALSTESVISALNRPVPPNAWLQDKYGLRIGQADAVLRVVSVWTDSVAGAAGISPGDEVLKVDGTPVDTESGLLTALDAEGTHELTLRRGRRTVLARMVAHSTVDGTTVPGLGLSLLDSTQGVTVRWVAQGSRASRAGLLAGDVIRLLQGSPVRSASALAESLNKPLPHLLTVARGDSQFEAELAP